MDTADTLDTLVRHEPFRLGEDVVVEYLTPRQSDPELEGVVIGLGIVPHFGTIRPGMKVRTQDGRVLRITGKALYSVTRKES